MRTIVESPEVMNAVDDASDQWSRFDDAWSAVTWALAKDPTVGLPLVEGGHFRSLVFEGSWAHDMPTIDLVYEITPTEIVLHRARFRNAISTAGRA